jgi:hypothetical protein
MTREVAPDPSMFLAHNSQPTQRGAVAKTLRMLLLTRPREPIGRILVSLIRGSALLSAGWFLVLMFSDGFPG